jgi:hypothetical protein
VSRDFNSVIFAVVWLRAEGPGARGSIPGRGERIFPLSSVSTLVLWPTQPPVQWVPGVLSSGLKRSGGVTMTTTPPPHLVPRSRMSKSYIVPPLPPSACVAYSGTALTLAFVSQVSPLLLMNSCYACAQESENNRI